MSILFKRSSKSVMFSRFLKVATMNEVYNSEFLPEFNVSILKEIVALVWDYVYETKK